MPKIDTEEFIKSFFDLSTDEAKETFDEQKWDIIYEFPESLNTQLDGTPQSVVEVIQRPVITGYSEGSVARRGVLKVLETNKLYSYVRSSNSWSEEDPELDLKETIPVEKTITVYEDVK